MTTCATCKFWRPHDQQPENGRCFRYPPRTTSMLVPAGVHPMTREPIVKITIHQSAPTTAASEWCGEHSTAITLAS